jgi:hypothetical protein
MNDEFNEFELRVLQKVCLMGRFCPGKHINVDRVVNGLVPSHQYGLCKDAIDSLVKKGFLSRYKAQGRIDICVEKSRYKECLGILASFKSKYDFINVDRLIDLMRPHDTR